MRLVSAPSPKEKSLRGAIIATPILSAPIPPAVLLHVPVAVVLLSVLAGVSAGYVCVFYALWTVGILTQGAQDGVELIGDNPFYIPALYWPFGPKQKRIRQRRRIRKLERACGIKDPWPL